MDTVTNDKYVVFKREELFEMMGQFLPLGAADCAPIAAKMIESVDQARIRDAVVIRRQDRFAANAFETYADQILSMVEMASSYTGLGFSVDSETLAGLSALADFFKDQAELSRRTQRKLPD
jgi:hypothetical protein